MLASMVFASLQVQNRPNIVYIMADDLGYGEVGCFGQQKIPTPNIDRLAKEGVRLTRFYSSSTVCAPARCSLLTGMHQGHAPIRGNKEQGGFGPNDPEGQFPLPKSATTVAEVLHAGGYRTGLIGKWGLGGPKPGENPLDHGFDRFYGYLCQRRAHNYYPTYLWSDYGIDQLAGNRMFDAHQKIEAPLTSAEAYQGRFGGQDYSPERMTQEAVKFIKGGKRGQPFFLYYATTLPHAALQAPQTWINRFPMDWDQKDYLGEQGYLPVQRPRATYAAMIAFLDDSIGRLLQALRESGQDNNTLVIFTSDNGPTFNGGVDTKFFDSAAGLRGLKMSLYEGGIREPFVARWPGKIPAGTIRQEPAVAYQSFATIAEVAGMKTGKVDGKSYLSLLTHGKPTGQPFLYFEYPEATSMRAVMFDTYKAIQTNLSKKPNLIELYDLEKDPKETSDLAMQNPAIVERARALFRAEHRPNRDFPLPGVDPR